MSEIWDNFEISQVVFIPNITNKSRYEKRREEKRREETQDAMFSNFAKCLLFMSSLT